MGLRLSTECLFFQSSVVERRRVRRSSTMDSNKGSCRSVQKIAGWVSVLVNHLQSSRIFENELHGKIHNTPIKKCYDLGILIF
jgi:hypothetical protein